MKAERASGKGHRDEDYARRTAHSPSGTRPPGWFRETGLSAHAMPKYFPIGPWAGDENPLNRLSGG
jgi:hypothetical protein